MCNVFPGKDGGGVVHCRRFKRSCGRQISDSGKFPA